MSDAFVDSTAAPRHRSPPADAGVAAGGGGGAAGDAVSLDHQSRRFDPLSYLESNAARAPEAVAVWEEDAELSFSRLRERVWALITRLSRVGIADGDVVAVALPNVAHYVALEIAVPASGAVLFPLPLGIGNRELAYVLERAGPRLLVVDDSPAGRSIADLASGLPMPPTVLTAGELADEDPARAFPPATINADPDRIVQIALTSGTTGPPKLASLSARLKQLTFEGFTTRLRVRPCDRMFPMSPITQGVGEMCLYALRCGATLVMSGPQRFDADAALAIAARSEATILGGVPTMIGRMLHSEVFDPLALRRLRLTVSAGAPLPPAVAREWETRTGSAIGSFFGAMDIGQLAVPDPEDPPEKRWTTVGRPHKTAELRIVDASGAEVEPGKTGELCMRGPLVQDRYWGEDAGPYDAQGWAHFGDLGLLEADGYVRVTGRIKDTIIRGGNNINPLEVEALLREHPAISDVCVVGRPDPDLGERAIAFVVPTSAGKSFGLTDLTEFLAERALSRYKWPEQVEHVDALPLGPTGKVDRKALRRSLDNRGPED